MIRRFSLRTVLLVTMLGLGLAPTLALVLALVPGAIQAYGEAALQVSLVRAEQEARDLARRTDRRQETVRNIAMLPAPLEMLRAVQGSGAGLYLTVQQATERFSAVMNRWFRPTADLKSLVILDRHGLEQLRLEALAGTIVSVAPNPEPVPRAQLATVIDKPPAEPVASIIPADLVIRYLAPIKALDGSIAGALAMEFDLRDLLGNFGRSLWIDGNGTYLGQSSRPEVGQGFVDYPELAAAGSGPLVIADVAWVRLSVGSGLHRDAVVWIGTPVDDTSLHDWAGRLLLWAAGAGGLLVLGVFLAVRVTVGKLVCAKQQLVTGLQRIIDGEQDVRFDWRGPAEVRDLGKELTQLGQLHSFALKTLRLTQFSVDHAAVGILWVTESGEIVYANAAAAAMLGASRDQLTGQAYADLLPAFTDAEAWVGHWRNLRREGALVFEQQMRHRDGALIPVEISANHLLFEGREYDLAFVTDIHERKLAEQRLQQSVEELTRLNVELERFTFIASHDLQEPVRTVVSFAQLLERRASVRLDAEDRENLVYLVEGARRMQALVQGLLDYSVITHRAVPFGTVDCRQAVEAAISQLRGEIERSGAVLRIAPLPTVLGDLAQIVDLFKQLLSNALKFSRPGVAPEIRVSAERGDGQWLISVTDNGLGIEPEYRPLLFTIFRRLHGMTYPGVGVGLAVCRRIVERHGGHIWVGGTAEQGAVFRFTLPAADPDDVRDCASGCDKSAHPNFQA